MNKEIKLTFDLSDQNDSEFYKAVESIPKTHQAIVAFKGFLKKLADEKVEVKEGESENKINYLSLIASYTAIFSQYGIDV